MKIGRTLARVVLVLLLGAGGRAGTSLPAQPQGVPWPTVVWPEGRPEADLAALTRATEQIFSATGRGGLPDTRALIAVQGGRLVLERYAQGFGPESRFRS